MNKKEIHRRFVDLLRADLELARTAAKKSIHEATDEAHKAESKYDTFSLESSYLARGQAQRVEELTNALERFQLLPMQDLDETSLILLSALVGVEAENGSRRYLFFGPAAGGLEIEEGETSVMVVTSKSPLGQAILGKRQGESFEIKMGPLPEKFKIISVA